MDPMGNEVVISVHAYLFFRECWGSEIGLMRIIHDSSLGENSFGDDM